MGRDTLPYDEPPEGSEDHLDIENNNYVDIPQLRPDGTPSDEWRNVATFKTREEAIKYAQEHFGADENGMVSLISQ